MSKEYVDVVVIGSGFGGSIPALRLAEAGKKVVVLERGDKWEDKDFEQRWDIRYLSKFYTVYYTLDLNTFFRAGSLLGGTSVIYSGAMLRPPSEVFEYKDRNGYPVWPESVNRKVLDPYFERVEKMMQIRQARWDEVPRAGAVFAMLLDRIGRTCDRGRFPFVNCRQCGFCEAGCIYGAKKHLLHNYIPSAEALGAEFRTGCEAIYIKTGNGRFTVEYRTKDNLMKEIDCDVCILAANSIETPTILLRSKKYLKDLPEQVGKNFNNNGDVAFFIELPKGFADFSVYKGRTNAVMITYDYWDEHRITIHTGCHPPAIFAALEVYPMDGWETGGGASTGESDMVTFGLKYKRYLKEIYLNRYIGCLAIGLIDGEGEILLGPNERPLINFPMTERLEKYIDRVINNVAREIAEKNGGRVLYTWTKGFEHGDAHPLSSVRMGDDPKYSPCDANGELRNYPGIFITDGSSIPGGTGVNPALTIAGNAERIADYIVKNY